MMEWYAFWETIENAKSHPLDLKYFKEKFITLKNTIVHVNIHNLFVEQLPNTNTLRNEKYFFVGPNGKIERIDQFQSLLWEILYCIWKRNPAHREELFAYPQQEIPKRVQFLKMPAAPENHLLFQVVPQLLKRSPLELSEVRFASVSDKVDVVFFLLDHLWQHLQLAIEGVCNQSHTIPIETFKTMDNPTEPEHNPWFWFFCYGSKQTITCNRQEEYVAYLTRRNDRRTYELRPEFVHHDQNPLLHKVFMYVFSAERIMAIRSSHLSARLKSLPERSFRTLRFRFTHSMMLSLMLLTALFAATGYLVYNAIDYFEKESAAVEDLSTNFENRLPEVLKTKPVKSDVKKDNPHRQDQH